MTQGQVRFSRNERGRVPQRATVRQSAKKERIIEVAMQHFASGGYDGARIDEIAGEAGVAKGAIFGYFTSKMGLFLAVYKEATRSFSAYLDAPPDVLESGFFATLTYWLDHTAKLIQDSWVPCRISLLGNYCTDLQTRREITQFLVREDPYGTQALVQFGIKRGEIRQDIDAKMIVSLVNWSMDGCQDAIVAEELDPGLFGLNAPSPAESQRRVTQFVELLRSAIGVQGPTEL